MFVKQSPFSLHFGTYFVMLGFACTEKIKNSLLEFTQNYTFVCFRHHLTSMQSLKIQRWNNT